MQKNKKNTEHPYDHHLVLDLTQWMFDQYICFMYFFWSILKYSVDILTFHL